MTHVVDISTVDIHTVDTSTVEISIFDTRTVDISTVHASTVHTSPHIFTLQSVVTYDDIAINLTEFLWVDKIVQYQLSAKSSNPHMLFRHSQCSNDQYYIHVFCLH